ncbi:hypothetical protein MLD38_003064 [Melastoma candidum]|uniref:Uncharacterized protein n=1 Tax=Melastoma candidum TaxID=119954 RepID=A0ACB9S160_9MYRT|nr:hypothetical protein MLD38_003064 [Melastoma candidum]
MLVLGAAFLLIASRLLASWVSGDLDCMEVVRDRQLTRTCLVFSWSTIIYGIPMLLVGALWQRSQSAQKLKSQNKMKHLRMWIFKCTEPSDLTLACLTLTEVTLAIGQSHVTGTGNTIE